MGYDLLPALCSASCDITHETGGTICNGHWALHLVISCTRQGVRFVTGFGFCILRYPLRDRGTICYVHWVLHHMISRTKQGARFVSDTRDTGYDLLRALGSASCDITHETGGTICYAH